ncbi:YbaN family protein [Marinobacter sp. es.048]|uniref:YbaN family protein n=1 Tax=Marinobacter sp. es.048 TaxID=1761795 RepID=UPI001E4F76B5|nr:YbaN family protein [Marinobacter sp. es.048]
METAEVYPCKLDAIINRGESAIMGDRFGKTGFRILAYISITLALAGVVLPLLPTTVFVLLAAFFASKGSPAFAQWLEEHPRFGPAIDQWRTRRAVPMRAKVLACSMMALSWGMLFVLGASGLVLGISGVFLCGTACYLVTRPSY